ncbi:MAG: hypothetical protein AB1505_14000 [Candidatus Latescibacterota bacterium]
MVNPENNRPFGLPDELFASFPLEEAGGRRRHVKPGVGVFTHDGSRSVLQPDARVQIGTWTPCTAAPGAVVTLRFTDAAQHPAVALQRVHRGKVAALATRPAWGQTPRGVIWDGWGQYHRACFAGLMGWLSGVWDESGPQRGGNSWPTRAAGSRTTAC